MGKLDIEPFIIPGILVGGLVAAYFFKDQLADIISQIGDLIPKGNGNGNGGDGDGDGDGDGNGNGKPSEGCPQIPCASGYECVNKKCVKKSTTTPKPTPKPQPTTGGQWFQAKGSTTTLSKGRQDGSSNRWNKNVTGWSDGFEVMGYLTVTGMNNDSHIGLKMAGPNHSGNCGYKQGGSCCCWWDGGLRRDGRSYLEIEYPHPKNSKTKYFTNMGRKIDDAGVLGVRWLNMKEGSARRVRFWVDTAGKANGYKWREMYNVLDKGAFMPTSYYNKIPNEIELEIRISDVPANKIKWTTGPIARKIAGSSNLAYAYDARTYYDRITLA